MKKIIWNGDFKGVSNPLEDTTCCRVRTRRFQKNPIGYSLQSTASTSGFALVIALGVMSLIVLLTLALSSMSNVYIDQAAIEKENKQAELNALFSLKLAMAEVKKQLGEDQRVSASAQLVSKDVEKKHWTGVWDSDPNSGTYGDRLAWLVSNGTRLPNVSYASIDMVQDSVLQDGVSIIPTDLEDTRDGTSDQYAWWVSDEGSKAKLNPEYVVEYNEMNSAQKHLSPGNTGVRSIQGKDLSLSQMEDMKKVMSRSQLEHVFGDDWKRLKNGFHNYTTTSQGVLSNTKEGGLKKNLTAALSYSSEFKELIRYAGTGPDNSSIFDSVNHSNNVLDDPGGPTWQQIRSFFQQGENVQGSFPNVSMYMVLSDNETSAVCPVMTQMHLFGYAAYVATGVVANEYEVVWFFFPGLTLWNPYNVALNIPDLYARTYHQDIDGSNNAKDGLAPTGYGFAAWGTTYGTKPPKIAKPDLEWAFTWDSCKKHTGMNWRDPLHFKIPASTIQPGQALIFSPEKHLALSGDADMNVLAEGFNPDFGFYFKTGKTFINDGKKKYKMYVSGIHTYRFSWELNTGKDFLNTNVVHKTDRLACYGIAGTSGTWKSGGDYTPPMFTAIEPDVPLILWNNVHHEYSAGESPQRYPRFGYKYSMKFASSNYADAAALGDRRIQWIAQHNPRASFSGKSPLVLSEYVGVDKNRGLEYHASYHGTYTEQSNWFNIEDNYNMDGAAVGTSDTLGDGLPRAVLFPVHRKNTPMSSITELTHTNFSKHYNFDNFPSFDKDRFLYGNYRPAYPIGNSFPDARIPNDLSKMAWSSHYNVDSGSLQSHHYDYSYEMNQMLYDRYFMSSLPFADRDKSKEVVLPLANSRIKPYGASELDYGKLKSFHETAEYIMIDGAFNINSTSVDAWTSILGSYLGVNTVRAIEENRSTKDLAPYARFAYPLKGVVKEGTSESSPYAFTGFRGLSFSEVQELAQKIVDEILLRRYGRGPFLSMSEFVNRDKEHSNVEYRIRGVIQAAIDKSTINQHHHKNELLVVDNQYTEDYPKGSWQGSVQAGAPGYLMQSDILSRLDSMMTARSDTFTIRAYGNSKNPSTKEIISQKWCEATLQRVPETASGKSSTNRKFIVTGFRWLSPDEI